LDEEEEEEEEEEKVASHDMHPVSQKMSQRCSSIVLWMEIGVIDLVKTELC
jgi:hypothetical protein